MQYIGYVILYSRNSFIYRALENMSEKEKDRVYRYMKRMLEKAVSNSCVSLFDYEYENYD